MEAGAISLGCSPRVRAWWKRGEKATPPLKSLQNREDPKEGNREATCVPSGKEINYWQPLVQALSVHNAPSL